MTKIITIDGPASSGKSTVGFLFAQKIGYQFIDSGLIYRVGSLLAKRNNISINDAKGCANLLEESQISFQTQDNIVKVFLDNEDVTAQLKTPEIDKMVPVVAAHVEVRESAKKIQRQVGLNQNTVMAGRDIGSEIFPEASLKFFITASVEARAKRRYDQQIKSHPEITIKGIEEELRKRDEVDSTRKASPMRVADDAIIVDTSDLNLKQVIEELFRIYKDKNLLPSDSAPA